ncbi:MAG: ABC transporter ATP-binding protein [Caldilineaceae bacterium]|nr:ABC transporter ATP-binding protein [Caldilineaceae bacterium]
MAEPFILCEGLVKIYQVAELEMVALQGLSVTIEQGELVGVIGASGSGKSTLMSILGGLDRPSAGRVRVDGIDLLKMPDRELNRYRREKVGFVWQQSARNLVPYLNAVQNVMLPMTLAGATGRDKQKRAEELLDMVGLSGRNKHHLPELSGGEQQRVAIAVALANSPTLLLADEPTGEVDSATALTIYETFQTLNREIGLTTLIVSHDPGIARHVQRVIAIRDGMLASETIRQARIQAAEGEGDEDVDGFTPTEDTFQELVVLDHAGRVHIPQEFLEYFAIKGRAQLEVTADGILIRPTESSNGNTIADEEVDDEGPVASSAAESGEARGVRKFFSRFGRKKQE